MNTQSHNDFPLYELLYDKSSDNSLSTQEMVELIENVKGLDKSGMNMIFVLIRIYSLKNATKDESIHDVPYNGQKMEGDVKFDIRHFPNRLNHMLLHFSKMHLKKDESLN
jgi:hypothetical protein